uniref:Uncharacterized protein n=1 Tax=Acrobeloides nanus TaxID=290746 RepID=A0A914DKC1_9BILA
MKVLLLALTVAICLHKNEAAMGWDGIQAVSVSGFQCLKNNGFSFFVARAWEEVCDYDYTGYQNIKNAWAGKEISLKNKHF